jgi:hypothetical protein
MTSETLHEFVLHYDWNGGIAPLREIASDERCSEATALMIFWRARPEDYARYAYHARKIEGDIEVFDLIRLVLRNYLGGFYRKTDIAYDPGAHEAARKKKSRGAQWEIPEVMRLAVGRGIVRFERYVLWLLMSTPAREESGDLSAIIATGDGLNHAIFTSEELNRGMSELLHNGYVERLADGSWRRTQRAEDFFAGHARRKREGSVDWLVRLSDVFQAMPARPGCVPAEHFSRREIEAAYRAYREMVRTIWKKTSGQTIPKEKS